MFQQASFTLQMLRLSPHLISLPTHPSRRLAVVVKFGGHIVEEDESHSLGQDDEEDEDSTKEPYVNRGKTER